MRYLLVSLEFMLYNPSISLFYLATFCVINVLISICFPVFQQLSKIFQHDLAFTPLFSWIVLIYSVIIFSHFLACVDRHRNCSYWAMIGECDQYPDWMHVKCPQSCGLCGPQPTAEEIEGAQGTGVVDMTCSDPTIDGCIKGP